MRLTIWRANIVEITLMIYSEKCGANKILIDGIKIVHNFQFEDTENSSCFTENVKRATGKLVFNCIKSALNILNYWDCTYIWPKMYNAPRKNCLQFWWKLTKNFNLKTIKLLKLHLCLANNVMCATGKMFFNWDKIAL